MEIVTSFLDVEFTIFSLFGYKLSLVELLGIVSGLASVYYAAQVNILTWPVGLLNIALFFLIFYQVQLYSDMLLQVFFALATIYGWVNWKDSSSNAATIHRLSLPALAIVCVSLATLTLILGRLSLALPGLLPDIFPKPAAFPYQDAFIASASMIATILMAIKALEGWVLWVVVDIFSTYLYFNRGIPFMGMLYGIFLLIAIKGFFNWYASLKYA